MPSLIIFQLLFFQLRDPRNGEFFFSEYTQVKSVEECSGFKSLHLGLIFNFDLRLNEILLANVFFFIYLLVCFVLKLVFPFLTL